MELIIKTNLEKDIPQIIDFNFEELKSELSVNLQKYSDLVVTMESIADAKGDRAKLNKLRTAVDDKRKSVKKACLAPYEEFEVKAKELIRMIDEPIGAIDSQVKRFNDIVKQEKYDEIVVFYQENIKELETLLPLEKILPAKWANVGEKLPDICKAIKTSIDKTWNDLKIIAKVGGEYSGQLQNLYLKNLDMSATLAEKNRLEEQAEALKKAVPPEPLPTPPETAQEPENNTPVSDVPPPQETAPTPHTGDDIRTVRAVFYDAPKAFRCEMNALIKKYNIKCEAI